MPNKSSEVSAEIYPRTYSAAGFWKFALYFCSALAVIGGAAGLFYSAVGQFHDLNGRVVSTSVYLAFTALGGYIALWLLRSKTILYADRIAFQGVFSTKAFRRDEIRGWRVLKTSPPTLVLERHGRSSFKTGLVFRTDEEFAHWFDTVPSLDQKETAISEARVQSEVENDARAGVTPYARRETLLKAKKTAKILAAISIGVVLWGFIYPHPYDVLIGLLALLPWIAIEVMRRGHGLFRADEHKNDAHPSVVYALIFPGMILGLRALLDYNVLQSAYAACLYVLVGCALFAAILMFDPTQRSRLGTLMVFLLCGVAYGYGFIVEADVQLDRSPGIAYTATIENKKILSGKSTTYELDLSPWGPRAGRSELDVSRSAYGEIRSGQTVRLKLKNGALGVQWYYLYDW